MEYNNETRLKYSSGLENNQYQLIVESLTARSSSEAVIAADLYAIAKCKQENKIPKIQERVIKPKEVSLTKTVTQSYICIKPNIIAKRKIASLKTNYCRNKNISEDIAHLCEIGLPKN